MVVLTPFEALLLHLVRTNQQAQVIRPSISGGRLAGLRVVVELEEGGGDVEPELEAHASLGRNQAHVVVWVGPEKIRHGAFWRRLSFSGQAVDGSYGRTRVGRQPPVYEEDLVVEGSAQGQPLEGMHEHSVHGFRVLGDSFVVKAVHLVHVDGLVVASDQIKGGGEEHLEGVVQEDHFAAEASSIDEIAVEDVAASNGSGILVVDVMGKLDHLEDVQDVVELPVCVSTRNHIPHLFFSLFVLESADVDVEAVRFLLEEG